MTYPDVIKLLNSLLYFERPPFNSYIKVRNIAKGISLERQKLLLKKLKNPEHDLKVILVAGTSGKGSISTTLAAFLRASGARTGLHVSPHLSTPRERLAINNELVSENDFVAAFLPVWEKATEIHQTTNLGMPSYFEILLGMALLYFQKEKCEYVVLEAGLGGKLDGVNAIEKPILSIITPIDKDHIEVLGRTYADITTDKSHIMRRDTPVVIAKQRPSVQKMLTDIAASTGAQLTEMIPATAIKIQGLNDTHFQWQGHQIELPLTGEHFAHNTAVVLTAMETLDRPVKFDNGIFQNMFLPARSEIIKNNGQTLILDGAHNPHKVRALATSLVDLIEPELGLIFTCMADKNGQEMIKILGQLKPKTIWISKTLLGPRAVFNMNKLKKLAGSYCADVRLTYSPEAALNEARRSGLKQILITGSMYYIGEIRSLLKLKNTDS